MKTLTISLARCFAGAFFVLTSMFCLLAYIPYTYLFLVKEPPMQWLIVFIQYHAVLYWICFTLSLYGYWPVRKSRLAQAAWSIQAVCGIFFTARHYIPAIKNDLWAYAASLIVLAPVLLAALADAFHPSPTPADTGEKEPGSFSFSTAAIAGVLIALISFGGSLAGGNLKTLPLSSRVSWLELAVCVLVTYLWLAIAAAFLVNVAWRIVSRATGNARLAGIIVVSGLLCLALGLAALAFLQNSLTFRGWPAWLYSVAFAITVSILSYAVFRPALMPESQIKAARRVSFDGRLWLYAITLAVVVVNVTSPTALKDADWNGVIDGSLCFLLWVFVPLSMFLLRPAMKVYSLPSLLAVALIAGSVYWGTISTAFLWAKALGTTDGAVARSMESYALENTSFGFARSLLRAREAAEACGELCQTLRQYANIRNAQAPFEVNLVDRIEPGPDRPPDIYMIVIDSVRRDYVGAYNPRVDFTPNLDALARDSFVIRNAYTQYAGTTLSEAALWTGVIPLHAHYMRPFSRLNNLEKLLRAEHYQVAVSYDSILRQILPDSSDLVKFDLDKPWNEFAMGPSLQQLESFMEGPARDRNRPLFFYTQPLNVHQFYRGKRTSPKREESGRRSALNRISLNLNDVDAELGDFFRYLKAHGTYENSIIIVTADHGDATGELGRLTHSIIIFPEVMQIPLIIHVPEKMRRTLIYDETSISSLTDVTPTLYYLLGQGPLKNNRFFGRPLFTHTREEMQQYPRNELFLASDVRATYGLLADNGHYMFTIYDSPLKSYLFDLKNDPLATNNILTDESRRQYQQRVSAYLADLAAFYQYKPSGEITSPARAASLPGAKMK
ncbi:MAG TPA: sulfatase-like hydrolase/transferase [Candidatus Saccharimonadales bacterium]|jgi:arylsulfatase A-like enzyme|nr:sulfatase-like hydrolase/transferase [Candidatus Saccharimonadales bacterium]